MKRSSAAGGRAWMSAAVLAVAGLALVGLSGCRTQESVHGSTNEIQARYDGFRLRAVIPGAPNVPGVMTAADQMFRDRGYAVRSSRQTEDFGFISAQPPRGVDAPHAVIEAFATGEGTRVEIRVPPVGDRELSQSLLNGLLRRLGL